MIYWLTDLSGLYRSFGGLSCGVSSFKIHWLTDLSGLYRSFGGLSPGVSSLMIRWLTDLTGLYRSFGGLSLLEVLIGIIWFIDWLISLAYIEHLEAFPLVKAFLRHLFKTFKLLDDLQRPNACLVFTEPSNFPFPVKEKLLRRGVVHCGTMLCFIFYIK